MLVGYPGETEEDFRELVGFVKESRFERMGVFTYSPEEGTTSYGLGDNVPEEVKQSRLEELLEVQQSISLELNELKIGKKYRVLVDGKEGDVWTARTEYDSPEVDNEVILKEAGWKAGGFYNIRITSASEFDLYGEKF
jgi:ribosomal protein S12 methylthiotransferase